ncbi:MAG: hypothetical protein RL240_2829 [Planctomycetota bacterium]
MAFSPRQTANPFRIRNTKTHHRFRPIHEFFDTLILSTSCHRKCWHNGFSLYFSQNPAIEHHFIP